VVRGTVGRWPALSRWLCASGNFGEPIPGGGGAGVEFDVSLQHGPGLNRRADLGEVQSRAFNRRIGRQRPLPKLGGLLDAARSGIDHTQIHERYWTGGIGPQHGFIERGRTHRIVFQGRETKVNVGVGRLGAA
jgi:hypothetical protein